MKEETRLRNELIIADYNNGYAIKILERKYELSHTSLLRVLKENGVEVYFEKESLWTFDSKCEILLTILSSIAQEESRNISENTKWGINKAFQDGRVYVPYKHFPSMSC